MPGFVKRVSVAAVAAASVATAAALALANPLKTLAKDAPPATRQAETASPSAPPAAGAPVQTLPDFTAIVRQYGPAVVGVSTVGSGHGDQEQEQGGGGPDDFFHRFGPGGPNPRGGQMVRGLGSGFIVKSDGLVLTNAHVVAGASEVTVRLTDKREFKAKVIGQDKETDVAVLKIDAKGLPAVRVGDTSKVQVGEWVLAIGSPFGFENTATAGIVSARARSLPGEGYIPFIQTDVAVNPGNSGGPLFNLRGEVIGINSQIYSGSGGYMGISFAIPIDVAMKVETQLVATGKVTRGKIGVKIQEVSSQLAKSFGLPKPEGALVAEIDSSGPAANSGLQVGDVILALNGQEVGSSADLPPRIADVPPGQDAKLTVWRDHKETEVTVKVGASGEEKVASNENNGPGDRGRLGLSVRPLSPDERRQAEVNGGVLVEGASGPAARAGIQPGDVVLAVNGKPVSSVDQLRSLVKDAKDGVALLVLRGDSRIFVPIDLG
jgi:serine protease Do